MQFQGVEGQDLLLPHILLRGPGPESRQRFPAEWLRQAVTNHTVCAAPKLILPSLLEPVPTALLLERRRSSGSDRRKGACACRPWDSPTSLPADKGRGALPDL